MKPVKTRVSLDTTKSGSQVSIPMFRGDTNRSLIFTLTENGKPYSLDDCDVAFTGIKADGNFLNNTCKVDYDKQVVIYNLYENNGDSDDHRQTTTTEGIVECQLVVFKNDIRVASACFDVIVAKTIYNEEDILKSDVALGAMKKYYVPVSRQIAGVDLSDDITAQELQTALNTYPIYISSSLSETESNLKVGQLALHTTYDGRVYTRDIYYRYQNGVMLIGGTTFNNNMLPNAIKKYLEENPIEGGNIDLSGYVKDSTTIAGLGLSGDISVADLQTALSVYPIRTNMYEPPTTFEGEVGQLCVGYVMTENPKLYMCFGKNAAGEYIWQLIGGGNNVDMSGYVPVARSIAGVDLSDDITAQELQTALNTYPIYISSSLSEIESNLKVGQLALYTTYDGKTWTRDIYYRFKNGVTLIGGTTFNNNMLPEAITKYLDENPIEVKSDATDEILEFSKSALPKTFSWEQGNLSSTDGSEVEHTNRHRTGFIPIDLAFKYYLYISNSMDSTLAIKIYRYDENKNFISPMLNQTVTAKTQQTFKLDQTQGQSYVRFVVISSEKDEFIRLYSKEQLSLATKKELKTATFGQPRTQSMLDYFGANKKVVIIGDSFSQGLGSSDFVSYTRADGTLVRGNGAEYGVEHSLPNYEIGTHIYTANGQSWYEALDGKGWAQMLKNYLQNKFGCTVNNYAMSGFTSGSLYSQAMNSSNTGLDLTGLETDENGNVRIYQALTKGFDTVLLTIGANDRTMTDLSPFTHNVTGVVEGLLSDNKNVILMSMTPCKDDTQMSSPMSAIDAALKSVAESYNLMFISNYQGMLDYCAKTGIDINTLRKDGIHPNDEGHAVVNSIICEALGINEVDKNYVDNALANFKLSQEDKLDIANMVAQIMSAQSGGESDA